MSLKSYLEFFFLTMQSTKKPLGKTRTRIENLFKLRELLILFCSSNRERLEATRDTLLNGTQ